VDPEQENWAQTELPSEEPLYTIYAVGDAGDADYQEPSTHFQLLKAELSAEGENSSLVFLGDNIYPAGLPPKDAGARAEKELVLDAQMAVAEDFAGQPYMIPGNHDWNRWQRGGRKAVKRQEKYVEEGWDRGDSYRPDDGCADPERVKVDKGLVFIFLDSQWFLHDHEDEKKMTKKCEVKSRKQYIEEFEDLVLQNKNKRIVVFLHHPLFTNGAHGGYFNLKQHVFPLTDLNHSLYIPLPVIGSIMPMWRKFSGSTQDVQHPLYSQLIDELLAATGAVKDIVFVSGHEHSLQYHEKLNHHFIVSGSGSKTDYASRGHDATFVREVQGYSKIYYYESGEMWVEFIAADENAQAQILYRQQMMPSRPGHGDEIIPGEFDPLPDSVTVAPSDLYDIAGFWKPLLGEQYREAWSTPITVPVLDLEKELGGLTPIKKGGGQASNSLRLEAKDGRQYALRSIDKDVTGAVPDELGTLRVLGLLQDQISAIHPYSAVVVPILADAAGVYHANPKVVYLMPQAALGAYNELFPPAMYMLEERPAGNREDVESFGSPKEVISYVELLDNLQKDKDDYVDAELVLRSRIFDLFIHDWDRHDDQWRWAVQEDEDGRTMYQPIPRDRDQTFYKFKGALPWFVSTFGIRKFMTFKDDLKKPWWESFNARYFDRYFLIEKTREDWVRIATDIQTSMTDDVIEAALREWPDEIYDLDGPQIKARLIERRANLVDITVRHYEYISKVVSIPGSDEEEVFDVERMENGDTRVCVYTRSKKGKKKDKVFDRTFIKGETKEIRLYGLNGKDEFKLDGEASKGINIRIIGGLGDDEVKDKSRVGGISKKTRVYDTPDGVDIDMNKETADRTNEDLDVNEYDREDFVFNSGLPLLFMGYNVDDLFFIGGGYTWTKNGFRRSPYKSQQSIAANIAPATSAFNFSYHGDFLGALRVLDAHVDAEWKNPYFINYFGIGNEGFNLDTTRQFNWVRMGHARVNPSIKKNFSDNNIRLLLGPVLEYWEYDSVAGRVAELPNSDIARSELVERFFVGGEFDLEIDAVDNRAMPENGFRFQGAASYLYDLESDESIGNVQGGMAFYITMGRRVKLTLANRIGAQAVLSDTTNLPFYKFAALGGTDYLRGYRKDRFRGKTAFSHQIDLRLNLGYWDNPIIPMDIGLLGGFDYGRVWIPEEGFNEWHQGFAAGVWIAPLSVAVINPYASWSEDEGWLFNFLLGFNF
jgi:hypothetical protein